MMALESDFFVEALCLLAYLPSKESKMLLGKVVEIYETSVKENAALEDETIRFYVGVIKEALEAEIDLNNNAELTSLMMKFQNNPAVIKTPGILTQIEQLFTIDKDVAARRGVRIQRKIRNWVMGTYCMAHIRKMYGKCQKCAATSDLTMQDTLLGEIRDEMREAEATFDETAVEVVDTSEMSDMSKKESIRRSLLKNEDTMHKNAYKIGQQGFARMFGVANGPVRGEFCAVGASSHNYKSGRLMDITRWIPQYNSPHVAVGKKAAIVFISLENEIYKNLKDWFMGLYTSIYKEITPKDMTLDQIVEYVYQEFNKHGFTLLVFRKDGDFFGFKEFQSLMEELESQGYEICAAIIDYMTIMRLDDEERLDKQIQKLGQRFKTYANHHNVLIFTGLQLNGSADQLNDSGMTNIVKRYGASHLSDCKSILKELDFFALQYIETNHLGIRYLTTMWKKHRYNAPPPVKDRYCAYRFTPFGLVDDIDGEDASVSDIYAESDIEEGSSDGSLY